VQEGNYPLFCGYSPISFSDADGIISDYTFFAAVQLTVNEAAELFGIERNKIRELTNDKDCPYVIWISSHRRIKREAFEKFISELFAV